MRYTPVKLFQAQAGTSETTQYTASSAVIVKQIIITNTSSSAITFGLSLVPYGSSAGTSNRIFPDMLVAPGITTIDMSAVMATSDFISMKASTASVVNVYASGLTVQ